MQATLAQVDALGRSDGPDMLRIADWDRDADLQLYIANCSKPAAPAALAAALGD